MKSFETSTTVLPQGQLQLSGLPFVAGTEVEVTVSAKRASPAEFATQWTKVCEQLRARTNGISDETIQQEIDSHRAGK